MTANAVVRRSSETAPLTRGLFAPHALFFSVFQAGDSGTTRGWVWRVMPYADYRRAMQKAPSRITGPFGRSSVAGNALCPRQFLNSSRSHLVPRAAPPRTASALLATGARLPQ